MKRWSLVFYGIILGVLLVLLQYFQYRFIILNYALEWYGGMLALLFTGVGIWAGTKLNKSTKKISPDPHNTSLESPQPFRPNPAHLQTLRITPREYEVLLLISKGLSNQEIADQLYLSLNTIKTHAANVMSKLEAERRTQAVQKAKELGLLP